MSHSCGKKRLVFKVREGNKVRFWVDGWFGVGPLLCVYPRLFRLALNKLSSVNDCCGRGWLLS